MSVTAINMPQTISIAFLVIAGVYGDGDKRKQKLAEDGYDPVKVQACVNKLYPIIKEFGD